MMQKYRLLGKKGEGTFSEVLRGQCTSTGRAVAIKVMRQSFASAADVARVREITALRRVAPHPAIVELIEVLYDASTARLALVFELADCNLYEMIKASKAPPKEDTVKRYMHALLSAVGHLHACGVFHRDIKPENLLLCTRTHTAGLAEGSHERGVAQGGRDAASSDAPLLSADADVVLKLADFGSVRGAASRRPFTEYISTRWYRAPECLLTDGHYGQEMDVWGVGCVMWESIALAPLFPGTDEVDQIDRIHKILGTPSAAALATFKRHASPHVDWNFKTYPANHKVLQQPMGGYSPDAFNLLCSMLEYDPEMRISAKDALRHPWFTRDQQKQAGTQTAVQADAKAKGTRRSSTETKRGVNSSSTAQASKDKPVAVGINDGRAADTVHARVRDVNATSDAGSMRTVVNGDRSDAVLSPVERFGASAVVAAARRELAAPAVPGADHVSLRLKQAKPQLQPLIKPRPADTAIRLPHEAQSSPAPADPRLPRGDAPDVRPAGSTAWKIDGKSRVDAPSARTVIRLVPVAPAAKSNNVVSESASTSSVARLPPTTTVPLESPRAARAPARMDTSTLAQELVTILSQPSKPALLTTKVSPAPAARDPPAAEPARASPPRPREQQTTWVSAPSPPSLPRGQPVVRLSALPSAMPAPPVSASVSVPSDVAQRTDGHVDGPRQGRASPRMHPEDVARQALSAALAASSTAAAAATRVSPHTHTHTHTHTHDAQRHGGDHRQHVDRATIGAVSSASLAPSSLPPPARAVLSPTLAGAAPRTHTQTKHAHTHMHTHAQQLQGIQTEPARARVQPVSFRAYIKERQAAYVSPYAQAVR